MSDARDERTVDLRPRATLAIGVTGHRNLDIDAAGLGALAATLDALFANLRRSLANVARHQADLFSPAAPLLRTICMAARGADCLAAQAARAADGTVACVLPFPFDEYRKDFDSPEEVEAARAIIEAAQARLILPGTHREGPRAYERANEIILANIDLLVAIWDRARPGARAGTGDVVQSAISSGTPVIVISPAQPTPPMLLVPPGDGELARPIAADLGGKPLGEDLQDLVTRILTPPGGAEARRGLVDLIDEQASYRTMRFEYPLLLKLFGVASRKVTAARDKGTETGRDDAIAPPPDELASIIARIDHLAGHYARLYRSSTVTEILVTIIAALASALTLIFFPFLAGGPIVAQMVVNGLVLIDARTRTTRRWHERWLDYRVIAERLRCLRFLRPLGLGLNGAAQRHGDSWVEWYTRRLQRALDHPNGTIEGSDPAHFAERLSEIEIPDQIKYHDAAFRQLGTLDHRLSAAASATLAATIASAVLFMIAAYLAGGVDNVSWKSLAWVLLFVLPAAAAAFTAMRAGADLDLLAERSATTSATLAELQRVIRSTDMTYDRAAVAATKVAGIMGDELSEWRFVFESRRARSRRRDAGKGDQQEGKN